MTRPKVLVVDTLSGSNDYAVSLATALAEKTDLTFLTVCDSRLPDTSSYRLLKTIPPPSAQRLRHTLHFSKYLAVLTRELWRHRKGIVHIQFFRSKIFEVPIYTAARLTFLNKLIFSAHNALPHEQKFWHKIFYQLWYRIVDDIQVLGNYASQQLLEMGVPNRKIHWIPHGNYTLFLSQHQPDPRSLTREKYGAQADDIVFLMYGLIRQYKGLDLLTEAFCQIPTSSKAYLIVAGGGNSHLFDSAIECLKKGNKDTRAMFRFGFVEDAELSNLVAACDVVVLPYRHVYQSGALLLSMTYGKPIIASNLSGFRDYVAHDREALLIDPTNTAEFSHAIETLSNDTRRRLYLGEKARSRALQAYGWPEIADQLVKLYADEN